MVSGTAATARPQAAAPTARGGRGAGRPGGLRRYRTLRPLFDACSPPFRFHMTTYVRQDFGVDLPVMLGLLSWVSVGSVLGILPRIAADVFGRRSALFVVTAGLCVVQWLVGFAHTPAQYAGLLA